MSQREPGSNVLVGGYRPEDIEQRFLERKRREETEQDARDRASRTVGSAQAAAAVSAGKKRGKGIVSSRPPVGVKVADISHWQSSVKTIHYGRFDVDSIRWTKEGYEFINLQTPIGLFSTLTLAPGPFTHPNGEVVKMDLQAWNNSALSRILDPINPPRFRMMPLWVRYALMAVCYAKKDSLISLLGIIDEIKENVWIPDTQSRPAYNATLVKYLASFYQTVIHGFGWPTDHPLYQVNPQALLPDGLRNNITGSSKRVIPALEALLYENDPGRARRTLLWASGQKTHVRMRTMPSQGTLADVTYLLSPGRGKHMNSAILLEHNDIASARPARGIKVDLDDFTPYTTTGGAP